MKQRTINRKTKLAAAAEMIATQPRLKKAADKLAEHLRDPENIPEPRLPQLGLFTEAQTTAIWMVARKQAKQRFDEKKFVEAMAATTPVLARPRTNDKALDLWRVLSQPEICEQLWPEWNSRTGTRGRDPGFFAKAVLTLTASAGISAHFDDNRNELLGAGGSKWQALFEWVEETAAAATGRRPQPFGAKSYEKTCEQINLITDPVRNSGALTTDRCHAINSKLFGWLGARFPSFGKHLTLDSMLTKGWVKQVMQASPEEEARMKKRAPNATGRYIGHGNGGLGRFARGYFLTVLSDLATGVPVAWCLFPAGEGYDDRLALLTLLGQLFEHDEDFPVETIVADRAWNSAECVRDCAVRYGIHLISGQDEPTVNRKLREVHITDSEPVGSYDGLGNAYCRQHGLTMARDGSDFVGRKARKARGLKPGDPASGRFRIRYSCPKGGGVCDKRGGIHMSTDWNTFSYYPHSTEGGQLDLQAKRLALAARRNTSEAIFGALKLGQKLGLESADRTHTANEDTLETLLSLGLLMRTAVVTANERIVAGEMPENPPPDLHEKLV